MITGPTGTTCLSDTAQVYRNEMEAGQALRESGIPRSEIFITTKYSGLRDVETSIQDSLKYVSSQVVSSLSLPFKFHHQVGGQLRRPISHPLSKVGSRGYPGFVEHV